VSVARRPLLTATAAGTLLCALWFVPSANATAERQAAQELGGSRSGAPAQSAGEELLLAQTGSVDTTPYVIGGTVSLGIGAGFVAYSMRRRHPGTA
jgi:LPXTG-motif cell wall-anchored protein